MLWEVNLGSPVTGYPITYLVERQTVRRRQHRDFAGHQRAEPLTPELHPTNKNAVYVFALGE